MKKILLVVDVQEDFIRGVLPGANALEKIPHMVERLKVAKNKGEYIIFTKDTHFLETYAKTQEGRNLPITHCIKNTPGWEIIEELREFTAEDNVFEKDTFGSVSLTTGLLKNLIEKESYEEIEIFGVCTDICVINTASLIKNFYPEIPISVNGRLSAGVTEELHNNALKTMESFQIKIL